MSTSLSRRRTRIAALPVLALVGASLALLPSGAAQATVTGTVTGGSAAWGMSTYLGSANPGRPNPYAAGYVAPATFDATSRVSTWGLATAALNGDGSASLAFDGATVNYTATSGSWLKLEDPQVDLDTDGNGTVTALVSYGLGTGGTPGNVPYDPAAVVRAAERIDVVNLTGNTAADRATTPAAVTWTGLDGNWDADFVDFLDGDTAPDPDIPAWPYAVTFTGAPDRLPLPMTFTVNRVTPTVSVTTTSTDPTAGVTLKVTGDGFRGVTNTAPPPADNGVYVGLAPAGGLPDVSSQAAMASFAAAAYVPAAAMTSGAISATLTAAPETLDPTKSYAIYTWQAHTHSNTTQDTVTAVAIDWEALKHASSV
ncbi:MAG TPA: hypothetical protein PL137_17000, partial [Nocardioides sp.]|nr:hypothetical protein [Nocardioides sp.]